MRIKNIDLAFFSLAALILTGCASNDQTASEAADDSAETVHEHQHHGAYPHHHDPYPRERTTYRETGPSVGVDADSTTDPVRDAGVDLGL